MRIKASSEAEDSRDEMEGLVASLPDRKPRGSKSGIRTKATIGFSELDLKNLRQAAQSLCTPIENFLLAGFAAFLCRLSNHENARIALAGRGIRTFSLESACSFEAMVIMTESPEASDASVASWPVGFSYAKANSETAAMECDLELRILEIPLGGSSLSLEAELASSEGAWDAHVLARWLDYLKFFWAAAGMNPAQQINRIPLLETAATLEFYAKYNQTFSSFPEEGVPELFLRQASLSPDATAVIFDQTRYSYRELEERSSHLASILSRSGAGPGRPVAICMRRSADMPMALLAVLKSGSCYVPLDPRNPPARVKGIFEECCPVLVLSDSAMAHTVEAALSDGSGSIPVLRIDEPWGDAVAMRCGEKSSKRMLPRDLAYIIYTSGSTGRPKGVMIGNRSLTNLLWAMREIPGITASDRWLALTTISFDIATLEMFLPLISGAAVVVAEDGAQSDAERLMQLIDQSGISVLQATPVTWRMLVEAGWRGKQNLKMLCGGEAIRLPLAKRLLELGGELWNCYGPTETTIYSDSLRIHSHDNLVRIGPPMANTSFYIMDEAGCPLPPGVPGELYIGGAGVGRGYLERPELTREKFLDDPFHRPERYFRTGDIARILEDGTLEMFGRVDHQVKLRGYRIELGAIESVLRTHPAVKDAVAVLWKDPSGEPQLIAYVAKREHFRSPASGELRTHAAQTLPDYMLPQRTLVVEKLPLTTSGKIDRLRLPDPGAPSSDSIKPVNAMEEKLLKIFRDVLFRPDLGVTDNFFDFGGYSLVITRLFYRINRAFETDLPLSLIYDAPTVRQLAALMEKGDTPQQVVPIRPVGDGAPLFIIHSYLIYDAMSRTVDRGRPLFGLRADFQDGRPHAPERILQCAQSIAEAAPQGPLYLAGWCAAASLTLEIARELGASGRQVPLVVLIDADRPGYIRKVARQTSLKTRLGASMRYHARTLRQHGLASKLSYGVRWLEALPGRVKTELLRKPDDSLMDLADDNLEFPVSYAWKPYTGKVVLIRASEAPELPAIDDTLGWGDIVVDGPQVVFVPGNHESMFRDPHLANFGRELCKALAANSPFAEMERASVETERASAEEMAS